MVSFIPNKDEWGNAGRAAGEGLVAGYTNRADEKALQNAIGGLGANPTPRQILDAVTGTKTYNPQSKQTFFKNALGVAEFEEIQKQHREAELYNKARNEIAAQKERNLENKMIREEEEKAAEKTKEREDVKALASQLDLPEETKKVLAESGTKKGVEALLKDQIKPSDEKLSPLERKLTDKYADEYISLSNEIPVLETNKENINHVEQLSKDLGYLGPIKGLLGTEKANELNAASFPLMQPIIKIFNPSGPIAVKKLEILQDKYQIKATDMKWKAQGKINALRRFNDQAIARAKERLKFVKNYLDNPDARNRESLENFDAQTETLNDAMIDYEIAEPKKAPEGMVRVRNKATGQVGSVKPYEGMDAKYERL